MATVSSHHVSGSSSHRKADRRTSSGRWIRRTVLALVGALMLVWLAPIVIGLTPLRDRLLDSVLSAEQGSISTSGASLGWFSPVVLRGVELRDPEGNVLATVPSIASQRRLLAIAISSSTPGEFRIDQPQLHCKLRSGGSNVEDFLAPWLAPDSDASQPISVAVEIVDGTLLIDDTVTSRRWNVHPINLRYSTSASGSTPDTLAASLTIADAEHPATLSIGMQMPPIDASRSQSVEPGQVELKARALPLAMFQSLVERLLPATVLAGQLTADMKYRWGLDGRPDKAVLEGEAAIDRLLVSGPRLGGDLFQLDRVHVPCRLTRDGNRLSIDRLRAQCDVGEAEAHGSLALDELAGGTLFASLAKETYSIRGRVDLVRLAALLPETLRIRSQTSVTSGEVELSLQSTHTPDAHRWQGQLATSHLAAVSQGRRITWDQPIQIALDAREVGEGIFVDRLDCRSDFLELTGAGTPDKLNGRARYDLNQLMDKLEQFVDLRGWHLSGQGQADFGWSRSPDGRFQAGATAGLSNFQLAGPNRPPWLEEQLTVRASASGAMDGKVLRVMDAATLEVMAGNDRLDARLTRPVSDPLSSGVWPLRLQLDGAIGRWLTRIEPWLVLPAIQVSGNCGLVALATYGSELVDVEQATLDVENLDFRGYGLTIAEPRVRWQTAARWNRTTGRLDVKDLKLTSDAVSLHAEQVTADWSDERVPTLSGKVTIQAALERLGQWMNQPAPQSPWQVTGTLSGRTQLEQQAGTIGAQADWAVDNLRLSKRVPDARGRDSQRLIWFEPKLTFAATGGYDQASDRLRLDKAQIDSQLVKVATSGSVGRLTTVQELDLSGTIDYDMERIAPLVELYVGSGVKWVGRETARFKLSGPMTGAAAVAGGPATHWSRRLGGELALGWQQLSAHGLDIGPGKLEAKLADGTVAFSPLDLPVSEGRLTLEPQVRLDPEPAELLLPKGQYIRQMRLSPLLCEKALRYVAPILSEATRTDGRFSLDLEGGRLPLANPGRADLSGRLAIHQLDVMPGPLANQFILIGKQVESIIDRRPPPLSLGENSDALVRINNQEIEFRMVEGRIYHRGLKITTGKVTIETHGSVGIDQTLALVAEIPVEDKWIKDDPILRGLQGQKIQVPIGGTFARPKIDGRAIEQLAAQMLRTAAGRAIADEVNKGLERFFGPTR